MSINIKSAANKATRATPNKSGNTGKSSKGAPSSNTSKPDNDSVDLTNTASTLQQIEQSLGDIPIVDNNRVEAISQSIDDGKYNIDNEKIADRIIRNERDINNLKK